VRQRGTKIRKIFLKPRITRIERMKLLAQLNNIDSSSQANAERFALIAHCLPGHRSQIGAT